MLPTIVSIWFQVLFHSPPGVLFTFPSRYCSAIGHQVVFSLGRWSALLPTGFLVSGGTLECSLCAWNFAYRIFTFFDGAFQRPSAIPHAPLGASATPSCRVMHIHAQRSSFHASCCSKNELATPVFCPSPLRATGHRTRLPRDTLCASLELYITRQLGLGSFPFARHYSGNRFYLSLPPAT